MKDISQEQARAKHHDGRSAVLHRRYESTVRSRSRSQIPINSDLDPDSKTPHHSSKVYRGSSSNPSSPRQRKSNPSTSHLPTAIRKPQEGRGKSRSRSYRKGSIRPSALSDDENRHLRQVDPLNGIYNAAMGPPYAIEDISQIRVEHPEGEISCLGLREEIRSDIGSKSEDVLHTTDKVEKLHVIFDFC